MLRPIRQAASAAIVYALATGLGPAGAEAPAPSIPPESIAKLPKGVSITPALACARLTTVGLPQAQIISAEINSSGSFPAPPSAPAFTGLPEFCRVVIVATPTTDSLIGIEVWIPTRSYRNRYLQVGNGGFSGSVVYAALADGVRRGYATASTDDGSQAGGSASFAMGRPEKVIDYGHRALKQTTDAAKTVIRAFKGADPIRSYFHGCSNGGREALMEAQRYPEDFDGIVAGAPANNFTRQFAAFVWNAQKVYPPAATAPALPHAALPILSEHVRNQCAGKDGGLSGDRFLTNPPACAVDLAPITCADPATCLSPPQAEIVRSIYRGPQRDDTGAQIYPGFEPGAESHACNWGLWITGKTAGADPCGFIAAPHVSFQSFFGWEFFRYFVHGSPGWNIHAMNFSGDVDYADSTLGPVLNAVDPDLRRFRNRGGKLIQYHGWDDAAVAPKNSIAYWASVEAKMRELDPGFTRADLDGFYRLFMAPGLAHCVAGPGLNSFGNAGMTSPYDADHDVLLALERWVEEDVAPQRIIARHAPEAGEPSFERPLCPFPKLPRYKGSGMPSLATSWSCREPRSGLPVIREPILRDPIIRPRPPRE